ARTLCDAEWKESGGCEGRAWACPRLRACVAQVFVSAYRRLAVDAGAQGRDGPRHGARNGIQRQRLRRASLGRAGGQPGGGNLQAARTLGAAREDDAIPRLVSRTPPPAAGLKIHRSAGLTSLVWADRMPSLASGGGDEATRIHQNHCRLGDSALGI